MFVIFFVLFYAIVSYSLPMLMSQAFHHAAASGARAGVAVEPDDFATTSDYIEQGVAPRVRTVVGETLSWLPPTAQAAVLGEANQNVGINFVPATGALTVTVIYSNYRSAPMIPVLTLPGIGDVPRLPEHLTGQAVVML
jgi:Flp pilus assembly protein TadG